MADFRFIELDLNKAANLANGSLALLAVLPYWKHTLPSYFFFAGRLSFLPSPSPFPAPHAADLFQHPFRD